MLDRVKKTIYRNKLTKPGENILVALSGGADSVSLVNVLCSLRKELNITVAAAHVNHGLRGKEADRDEEFVKKLAEKLGIEIYVKHADIRKIAENESISEEMAGRKVRYAFFDELAEKYNFDKIATAHNKNDNAETIVMNFMRGASLAGLTGIPYRRGNIIRPILDICRDEIEKYCADNMLEYVTDSTNAEHIYTRNKIRLDLIPYICKSFNSNFVNTVTNNSHIISDMYSYIDTVAENEYEGESIKTEKLNSLNAAVARQVIYKMLNAAEIADLSSVYIEEILRLSAADKSGSRVDLPGDKEAALEHGILTVRKKIQKTDKFEYELEIGKEKYIPELDMYILISETDKREDDCFTVEYPCRICVRNRREGDVFYPAGMQGRKKLKDFFIDKKIPVSERDRVGILTFNGEIGYIIGKRRDRRFDFDTKGIKVQYRYCNKQTYMLQ